MKAFALATLMISSCSLTHVRDDHSSITRVSVLAIPKEEKILTSKASSSVQGGEAKGLGILKPLLSISFWKELIQVL